MKSATKISIMSGLVTAGALLCGVHIANAQTNFDTGYTITIPSEVGIDKDSGKGSFCFWKNGCTDRIRCNNYLKIITS